MIAIARSRAPGLAFTAADMVTWRPEGRYDLVTCTGDALNHIFDPGDVARVFRNVHDVLTDGGFFIFDLLNASEVPSGEAFEAETSDGQQVRFHTELDPDQVVRLTVEVREDGRFRYRETILEKLHDPAAIQHALRASGLTVLQCADRLNPEALPTETLYIAAQRR